MRSEAQQLLEVVVEGYTSALGPAHARTLRAEMNLAIVMMLQGDLEQARDKLALVAAAYRLMYGAEHDSTLGAEVNLAGCLHNMGRGEEARGLYGEVAARSAPHHSWFAEASTKGRGAP